MKGTPFHWVLNSCSAVLREVYSIVSVVFIQSLLVTALTPSSFFLPMSVCFQRIEHGRGENNNFSLEKSGRHHLDQVIKVKHNLRKSQWCHRLLKIVMRRAFHVSYSTLKFIALVKS